jgi:hypothetical protein
MKDIDIVVDEITNNRTTFDTRANWLLDFFIICTPCRKICMKRLKKRVIGAQLRKAENTRTKFRRASGMIYIMRSIHRLNLFMKSETTRSQRILMKF